MCNKLKDRPSGMIKLEHDCNEVILRGHEGLDQH